ncbi:MAG: T9SS type A sorting domain-containing protein [Lewinellaceae bacterium]|nr:T9SS type A sorting domain-containing protein [Lewinellaceae bacterium]
MNYQPGNVFSGLAAGNYTAYARDTDNADCTASTPVTVPVSDDVPPVFDAPLPVNITVSCSDPLPPVPVLTASDNVDPVVEVTVGATLLDGDCPQELFFTYTWTATDDCGNTATVTQTVTVVDDTPPVFNQPLSPSELTVACSDPLPLAPNVTASDACDPGSVPPVIFINEIHYDNVGTDAGEFIEIAGTAGLDLSQYQLVLYNGNGGVTYDIMTLSGTIDNEGSGFGAVSFPYPVNGIQNGAPDGMALIQLPNTVIQFLSYEGSFVAQNGPATGMTSSDIGVAEEPAPAIGLSLQLTGAGQQYGNFTWTGPAAQSPGSLNAGQSLSPLPGVIQAVLMETSMMGDCAGEMTVMRMWTATDACGNSTVLMQTIHVVDDVAPAFVPPIPQDITISCSDPVPPAANLLATDLCDDGSGSASMVWINEIHYDNVGGDVGEFIEVAGTAGVDLSAYSIFLYNGAGGGTYGSMSLSGVIPNQSNGFGTLSFSYPVNGLQNGAPDGLALVTGGMVVQFLSYEGTFTAVGGPANGMLSTDIGVLEDGNNAIGTSLQLSGTGNKYSDFVWNAPATATSGAVNNNQFFIAVPVGLQVTFNEVNTKGSDPANCNFYNYTITRSWSVEDDCGNVNNLVQVITVQDATPPAFNGVPANVTLSCSDAIPAVPTGVTVSDNCSATTPIVFNQVSTKGASPAACNFYTYTITRTWTSVDVCGNVGTATQVITVQDVVAPTVSCQNITVGLNTFGNVTISPASVGYSAGDNCAGPENLTLLTAPVTFTCAQAGTTQQYTVQVSDPCNNTGSCTAQVTIQPFPRCVPKILISDACVCKNNATNLANGQFGETIKIESLAGKVWTVTAVSGLYAASSPPPPAAPVAITVGTQFVENPLNSGDYFLSGIHIDDLGYTITVQSATGEVLTIGNSCKYPNPTVTSDLSGDFCLFSAPVPLTGTPGDNNIVSQGFTINGVPATVFNPSAGVGQYVIVYTVDGGTPKAAGPDDPGCIQKITNIVNVVATPANLVCNDLVHVSLDADCEEFILPDDVLEGTYNCYDDYKVELDKIVPYGNGPWSPAFINAADIGKTYAYRVTHLVSGNICWGNIKIEDKLAPTIQCADIFLNCVITNYTPDYLSISLGITAAYPDVTDCSAYTLTHSDTWHDLACDETVFGMDNLSAYVERVWTAKDAWNNTSTCVQFIYFERVHVTDLTLPPDVTVGCGNANTDPSATGAPFVHVFNQNFPLYPGVGFCELNAVYVDQVLEVCDGTYKILRTWTLYDWCLPTNPTPPNPNPLYYIQVIKVTDEQGPVMACPANLTVSTDPFVCCAQVNLPDVIISDNCSRINNISAKVTVFDPYTGDQVSVLPVGGALTNFPGNNLWNPDTLGAFGVTPCIPIGTHTVVYTAQDDCGNSTTCSFKLTVRDYVPPVAACDEHTIVGIGIDDPSDCYTPADGCDGAGVTWVKASTFNDGSYDNCSGVKFTIRRMAPYSACIEGLEPCEIDRAKAESDSIKFYCCEVGTTQNVILRVYQLEADGLLSLGADGLPIYNECMIEVEVQDKIKPVCVSPANVTVSCEAFDPSLWAYGKASVYDNCCLDTAAVHTYQGQCGLSHSVNYNLFDTVCNRGTITRTFRAWDCHGQSSQCTQRIIVNYEQDYFVKFPNDVIVTACDGTGNYGEPVFFGEDCELLGVSHEDEVFTVVPDACLKIERTWTIINWCTYNPNGTCVIVPNPNPNATSNSTQNLPGPTVSACGTPAPWNPTVVAIAPGQPQTNFCTFYDPNANCYKYKQIIKIIDTQKPTADCPASPVEYCDVTTNDAQLWNQSYWWDAATESHDLCEGNAALTITATDACSGANVNISYLLFLDLDNNGSMETVVSSNNPPAPGTVNYNNAGTPNYSGGTPQVFDGRPVLPNEIYRWANHQSVSGTTRTAAVQWKTLPQMPTPNNQLGSPGIAPQLPYGTHKIKWTITDGCGNETYCEYTFVVKDCKPPTVVCFNGLSVNIMPTQMVTMWATDFLQYAEDNCTPTSKLKYAIRKLGQGAGFPVDALGNPITSVTFTCADLGSQLVELWAQDLAGNAAFCQTFVDVQDNNNNCTPGDKATVAGALATEAQDGIEDANVNLQAGAVSLFDMSDDQGQYAFPNAVPYGMDYTVTPTKDDNPLNGVSTFDLVLISKHILGLQPLNSPYKMIAADANKSNSITTFDIVEIRKLILGIYSELPNNTSWRFVDMAYNFPQPTNPFATQFPETKSVANVQSDQLADDFVGVKIGDVNGTAIANALMNADDRAAGTLLFDVEDRDVKAGEVIEVNMAAAEATQGYQFTLNLSGLEVADIVERDGVKSNNFGVFADALTVSIDGVRDFTVRFRATRPGRLSEMLGVSSRITRAEAYSLSNNRLEVALRFNGQGGAVISGVGFELYQNQPNPFVNKTLIGFHLPEASEATLSIFDETGRMLFTQKGQFGKGYNAIAVDRALLNTTGVMYYKLETATDAATKKMIQTK